MKCGVQLSVHLPGIFRSQFLGPWGLRPEYSGRSVTRVKYHLEVLILGSSCIDMPLPDRTKVTASNHSCSVHLDTSTSTMENSLSNFKLSYHTFMSTIYPD